MSPKREGRNGPGRPAILDRFAEDAGNAFLAAYRAGHAASEHRWVGEESETALLDLFLMEKAAYEICYEAANRPAWKQAVMPPFM